MNLYILWLITFLSGAVTINSGRYMLFYYYAFFFHVFIWRIFSPSRILHIYFSGRSLVLYLDITEKSKKHSTEQKKQTTAIISDENEAATLFLFCPLFLLSYDRAISLLDCQSNALYDRVATTRYVVSKWNYYHGVIHVTRKQAKVRWPKLYTTASRDGDVRRPRTPRRVFIYTVKY